MYVSHDVQIRLKAGCRSNVQQYMKGFNAVYLPASPSTSECTLGKSQ